jgi:hypothetical protein
MGRLLNIIALGVYILRCIYQEQHHQLPDGDHI